MKTFIGITQNPQEIEQQLQQNAGLLHSLTEIGPFPLLEEARRWCEYLKNNIQDIEEIEISSGSDEAAGWYGFTFEQDEQW